MVAVVNEIPEKIQRLVHLAGSDAGFYVLAVHSFVEHFLRDILQVSSEDAFKDLVWSYRGQLIEEAAGRWIDGLYCLSELGRQHHFTNEVRHGFKLLAEDEAVAATHLFVIFCRLAGLSHLDPVKELEQSLEIWQERESVIEKNAALAVLQQELATVQEKNRELLGKLDEYEAHGRELRRLELKISEYSLQLEDTRERLKHKDERLDELRHERARLKTERKRLLGQMERFEDLRAYISNLGRFSVYTRTRLDYERSLTRLTPEQRDAVDAITLEGDFLVKGGAGTGKSLVLIEALRTAVRHPELDFGNRNRERLVLLTFTRTLAKFDAYVTAVLKVTGVTDLVHTVDSFFRARLRQVVPGARIDYEIMEELCSDLNTTGFLSDAELCAEVEGFLFANLVSREEYLDEVIERTGMRRRLSAGQRRTVWDIAEEMITEMESARRYSKNYARVKILEYLKTHPDDTAVRDVRYLFLDETQDLAACDLTALR